MDYKNYRSGGLKLCDYLTLDLSDTSGISDGVYEWIIPTGSYYSDRRSQVCTVESGGTFKSTSQGSGGDEVILISYENGGFNHYTTGNGRPVIGVWSDLDQRVSNGVELLVDARPQLIKLKLKRAGGANVAGTLSGVISLKFKYYNSIQSQEQLHSEYTPIISL